MMWAYLFILSLFIPIMLFGLYVFFSFIKEVWVNRKYRLDTAELLLIFIEFPLIFMLLVIYFGIVFMVVFG